jgi:hypothetical protein
VDGRDETWKKNDEGDYNWKKYMVNGKYGVITTFKKWIQLREATANQPFDSNTFDPQQIKPVRWHMPDVTEEHGEIVRQAEELNLDVGQVESAVQRSRIAPISNVMLSKMQNTTCNVGYNCIKSLQEVMSWDLTVQGGHRDVHSILSAFQQGGSLPAPIVLVHSNVPYVLAGNTRFAVCKVLGVQPQALIVQM